jgi:F-type H+-transporting ATPase subunit delta
MAEAALCRRYARALVSLGKDEGQVERFGADLAAFTAALDTGGGDLRAAMSNPGLTIAERRGLLDRVIGRLDLHLHSRSFLRILVEKNRFDALDGIAASYAQMADELAGRVRVDVRSAQALDADETRRVESVLAQATGKRVVVRWQVDPSLIGGVVAQVGDRVIDASIKARLRDLERSLLREPDQAS